MQKVRQDHTCSVQKMEINLVQPAVLKKIKTSYLSYLIYSQNQVNRQKNVTLLSTCCTLHDKMINDGKEKPQIIKF